MCVRFYYEVSTLLEILDTPVPEEEGGEEESFNPS